MKNAVLSRNEVLFKSEALFKKLLFLFLYLQVFCLCAQATGPFNQYDAHHKKTGYWKVFFDDQLFMTDSLNAFYFGYDYYFNGKTVNQCTTTILRKKNFVKLEHEERQPVKGHPVALDGLFKTYDDSGLSEELLYQNGICLRIMSYFSGSNVVFELIDYTQRYQGKPYSFRHQLRKNDGSIKHDEWLYPNEKGVLKLVKIQ